MMLVNDNPFVVAFFKTHGQPKVNFGDAILLFAETFPMRGGKG